MRRLEELLDPKSGSWAVVSELIAAAKNGVEVLPRQLHDAEATLVGIQVTTGSPMGAIAYETGGLLVDGGWLRILGSGHPRLPRDLARWNFPAAPRLPGAFLVADDAVGPPGGATLECSPATARSTSPRCSSRRARVASRRASAETCPSRSSGGFTPLNFRDS